MKSNSVNLTDIDKIIFDMDGVITSEYMYWDAAALSAFELLTSNKFYGSSDFDSEYCMEHLSEIHKNVLLDDKTTKEIKRRGVNTNWDLAYLIICLSLAVNKKLNNFTREHSEKVYNSLKNMTCNAPEIYEEAEKLAKFATEVNDESFKRTSGKLWNEMQLSFQHWFLGTESYKPIYGEPLTADFRKGLVNLEKPVIELEKIQNTLNKLYDAGIMLGIGTGRPEAEIQKPIEMWDIKKYFDKNSIVTYSDVMNTENKLKPEFPLAKPHPYVFLKAAFGSMLSDEEILYEKYNKEKCKRVLIVGDAPSDFLAAKAAGFKFAAVLTGVSGKAAEKYFKDNDADYILENVSELI